MRFATLWLLSSPTSHMGTRPDWVELGEAHFYPHHLFENTGKKEPEKRSGSGGGVPPRLRTERPRVRSAQMSTKQMMYYTANSLFAFFTLPRRDSTRLKTHSVRTRIQLRSSYNDS